MRRTAAAGERAAFSPPVFLCDLGPLSFSPAIVNWVPGARSLGQACISELTVEGMRDRDMALEGGGQGSGWWGKTGNSSGGDVFVQVSTQKGTPAR